MTTEKKIEHSIIMQSGNILNQIPNLKKAEKNADHKGIEHILNTIETNLNTIKSYEVKLHKLEQRVKANLDELKDEELNQLHLEAGKNEIELEKKISLCEEIETKIKAYGTKGTDDKDRIIQEIESHIREIQQHASNIIHFESKMESRLKEIQKDAKELSREI